MVHEGVNVRVLQSDPTFSSIIMAFYLVEYASAGSLEVDDFIKLT